MSQQPRLPHILRFGVFQLDVRAGELHKKGVKIKLQEKPFKVLACFLERPDELVSREEIRNRVWPAGWESEALIKASWTYSRVYQASDRISLAKCGSV